VSEPGQATLDEETRHLLGVIHAARQGDQIADRSLRREGARTTE
jgi:hypothetical protein